MGNIFKINCRKLYETGLYIDKEVEKLEENVTEMKKITKEIGEVWSGIDYDNFSESFINYLDTIKNVEDKIKGNTQVMEILAAKHSNIDLDLKKTMDLNRGYQDE